MTTLPTDILQHLFHFLPTNDLASFALTNHHIYDLALWATNSKRLDDLISTEIVVDRSMGSIRTWSERVLFMEMLRPWMPQGLELCDCCGGIYCASDTAICKKCSESWGWTLE